MWGLFLFWSMRSVAHVGLSSPTRDQTHIRYVGKQILNHWNNREVLTFLKCYLWIQFSFLKHNVKYFREGRSREAFWGLIILVFLRAIFCCIHVRIHPCLEARETSLSLRGATVHGATVHGATLCSIHSSLFWSFSNCIVSFTGFSARIQKYLKLSVSLAFHLLPFPKLKKFIRQTHSLFFCFYIEQWNYHLPKCSPLCFHRCFQVCPDAVPLASSYLTQSLPDSSIFPYVLVQVSLQLGSVPGTRQPK